MYKEVVFYDISGTYFFRYEGFKGFYKGIVPNLLRVIPATAITFVVYENVSRALLNWRKVPAKA